MALGYPANSHWRMQALARHGRVDAVLREWRERWARLPSVLENNTISEDWGVRRDSPDQWSHCAVGPLFVLFMDVAGIRPAAPGFERVVVRPQLGDLPGLELTCHTVRGSIGLRAERQDGGHRVSITLPEAVPGELLLRAGVASGGAAIGADRALGLSRFALPAGETTTFDLPSA